MDEKKLYEDELYSESGIEQEVFDELNERFKKVADFMKEFELRDQDTLFYFAREWWNKEYLDMSERYQSL